MEKLENYESSIRILIYPVKVMKHLAIIAYDIHIYKLLSAIIKLFYWHISIVYINEV